jgi:hypothetical protein
MELVINIDVDECPLWVNISRNSISASGPLFPLITTKSQTSHYVGEGPLTSDLRLDAPQQSLLHYSKAGGGVRDIVS